MKSKYFIIIIFIKIYIILLIKNIKNNYIKINLFNNKNINKINIIKIKSLKNLSFKLFLTNYSFSFKFKIAKLEYSIEFYNKKNNSIAPPYLTLFHNLHIFCIAKDIKKNISIFSIPNIDNYRFYKCIEYLKLNEHIKLGFSLYKINNYIEYFNKFLFIDEIINYNDLISIKDSIYEPYLLLDKYKKLKYRIKINNKEKNSIENLLLKESYVRMPNFSIKFSLSVNESSWYFKNIYNDYFCFCKSNISFYCPYKKIKQKCKYYLYLNIIDINRNIFNKTDYLFVDFSSPETAPGEAFLIFNEMNKQNFKVHYMTKREDIYKNFSNYNLSSENKIIFDYQYINGNFLEKYLEVILKLKSTISGAKIYSINNLFYNIEYLTYICLGHGISYLKDFLYIDYYSINIYNKILIPNSNILISNAKKYGWKDKNIIKIGLPRWDTFIYNNRKINSFQNRSIFMMFTWRDLNQNNNNSHISQYYFKNIIKLINNLDLNIILKENNITLYFCLHHMMEKYKLLFNINKNIKYIDQNQIIECLINSDLFITDFSSVIFDFIFRKKPYIIFIPDFEDLELQSIYSKSYYDKINYLKNGSFFENRFFKIKNTVDKIIYYINNNFELDSKMHKFYNYINLKSENNIQNFIQFLKNLNQ